MLWLKAGSTSLGELSPETFGAQVLLQFGWQLETVVKMLQQENPKLTQSLEKNEKKN